VKRRLVVTLSWLTPVKSRYKSYAVADLWVTIPDDVLALKRVDVDHVSVRRGTVQHEIFEGTAAVPISAQETLELTVSCRSDAGKLLDAIPYALMVTLEVAEPLGVDIHEEVRLALVRLREAVQVQPNG